MTTILERIVELQLALDALDFPEMGVRWSVANVSNPPLDAEIDGIWTSPATFKDIGVIDDNNAHTNYWLIISDGTRWIYWAAGGVAL